MKKLNWNFLQIAENSERTFKTRLKPPSRWTVCVEMPWLPESLRGRQLYSGHRFWNAVVDPTISTHVTEERVPGAGMVASKEDEWDKVRKYKHHLTTILLWFITTILQTCLLLRFYDLVWFWYEIFLNMISSRLDLDRSDSVGSDQGLMIETYWNQTINPQVPPGVLESKFLPQEAHSQLRGCDAKAPGSMRRMAFKWDSGTCKENLTVLAKTGNLKFSLDLQASAALAKNLMEISCCQSRYIYTNTCYS